MSFLKRIFGFGGSSSNVSSDVEGIIEQQLETILNALQMNLSFNVQQEEDHILVEFKGSDEQKSLFTDKDGMLIDALQFYVKRVLQHNFPDLKTELVFDTDGFREKSSAALVELAEKLKNIALTKNKSVYFRALPPKDRKVIHQHLAQDERVKSKSVGDGLFKKIKVFPAGLKNSGGGRRGGNRGPRNNNDRQQSNYNNSNA
jgi:spoIIIJ-associated protein